MGLFSKSPAKQEYDNARKALEANSRREKRRGIKDETPAFRRLNSRVIKAEKQIPWWQR